MSQFYYVDHSEKTQFSFLLLMKTKLYNLPILNTLKGGDNLYICE